MHLKFQFLMDLQVNLLKQLDLAGIKEQSSSRQFIHVEKRLRLEKVKNLFQSNHQTMI